MVHQFVIEKLKNNYFALRHGQSGANAKRIILSHPQDGRKRQYALTPTGKDQVRKSVRRAMTAGWIDNRTIICSSPLSRCRMTAEIAREELSITDEIIIDDRLQERWFGNWEKTLHSNYQKVWDDDKKNPKHTIGNVESALAVQRRLAALIGDLERQYQDKNILLVSHGDPLQILQTWFQKKPPSDHRDMPHLSTAGIRKLEVI